MENFDVVRFDLGPSFKVHGVVKLEICSIFNYFPTNCMLLALALAKVLEKHCALSF